MAPSPDQLTYPYTYPWFAMNLFLVLYVLANFIKSFLYKASTVFRQLDNEKQHNAVTYVIEIVVTIFALCTQCYGGREVVFADFDTWQVDPDRMEWATFSLQTISVLYVWELTYRLTMGWPLLMHHVCTLLMVQLVSLAFAETHSLIFLRFALLMGLHATMEQTSFIALLAYRLHWYKDHQSKLFIAAACQSFLVKTFIFVGTTVYYCSIVTKLETTGWFLFWKLAYLPLHFTLYLAQLYACKILFILAKKSRSSGECKSDTSNESNNRSKTEEIFNSSDDNASSEEEKSDDEEMGGTIVFSNMPTATEIMERAMRCFPDHHLKGLTEI